MIGMVMSHLTKNLITALKHLGEAKKKSEEAQIDLIIAYRFCMVFFSLGIINDDEMNEINQKINRHISDLPFPTI